MTASDWDWRTTPSQHKHTERVTMIRPIQYESTSPIDPDPNVCRFYGRCPKGADICTKAMPPLRAVGPDHFAACHFALSPLGGTDER